MAKRVQQSKRARTRQRCPDCGEHFWNRGAHAEACHGVIYSDLGRCQQRIPGYGHGIWTYCVRPWGHQGEHLYR